MATGLVVRDLSVAFGDLRAVDGVDLDIPPGSVLAVLGPSGCGKSTLLRAVAGVEQPLRGSIRYADRDLAQVPAHRRGFALMFQDGQLFPHLDVAGNVGYALRLRRVPRARRRARVAELLELVHLAGYEDRAVGTLSGGERQRVALARALAVEPRLLLLDEPLSALDRSLRDQLALDIREILHETDVTGMFVTHDQEEAFAVADRMAVMRAGRIVQVGTIEDVWAHPVDAWTARFLGYATVLDGAAARRLREVGAPGVRFDALALRRSGLRVDTAGPLRARVAEARVTPDQVRVLLEVEDVGLLPGVADPGVDVPVGAAVHASLDLSRCAALPGPPGAQGPP